MSARRINNRVRLAGKITNIYFGDKTTTMIIDTGLSKDGKHNNFPRVVAFEKILGVTSHYKAGDYVLIDATMQANKNTEKKDYPPRTIAVNHIGRLNPESPKYHNVNSFDFYGRLISTKKISANEAIAKIRIYTNQANYITVHFKNDNESLVDKFVEIEANAYVHLVGQIETSRFIDEDGKYHYPDKLVVYRFKAY